MRFPFLLALSAACLAHSFASQAQAASPSVDEILKRQLEASGDTAIISKLTSEIIQGRIEFASLGVAGTFEVRAKAPNKRLTRTELPGIGTIREGSDGSTAWSTMPGMGTVEKSGNDLARARREAVFHRELHLKEIYETLRVAGEGSAGNQKTWVIEAKPREGGLARLHFDSTSGLLVRVEETVESNQGRTEVDVTYEDFKSVGGVKQAHRVRLAKPAEIAFTLTVTNVSYNAPLKDAEFGKPAE